MSASLEEIADLLALRALVDPTRARQRARRRPFAGLFTPDGSLAVYETRAAASRWSSSAATEALRRCMDLLRHYTTTFHLMANHLCEVAGDEATGEVYCMAHHIIRGRRARPTW